MNKALSPSSLRARPRHLDWTWFAAAPSAVTLVSFVLLPAVLGLLSTFTNYDPFGTVWHLVGLANYRAVLSDRSLVSAFGNALIFTALAVPFEIALGLGLARANLAWVDRLMPALLVLAVSTIIAYALPLATIIRQIGLYGTFPGFLLLFATQRALEGLVLVPEEASS